MCQTASKFMPHLLSKEHEFVAENKTPYLLVQLGLSYIFLFAQFKMMLKEK